ncbi:MAG: serine/threonine-protein kinase [Planctomycetota bacterium]
MPLPLPPHSEQTTCLSQAQLANAAQGTLEDAELEQLNQHLSECEPCRNRFDTILQNTPPAPFLLPDTAPDSMPGNTQLEAFLQRISMASWRDFPDLGEQYKIVEKIGQGGMGEVFKCFDTRLSRMVAVKRIRPDLITPSVLQRLSREARIQAGLDHPNITRIIEIGNLSGVPFIAMELVAGGSLRQLIQQAPLAPLEAAQLMAQIANATHFAHQRGILHRDLKPSNILLAEAEPASASRVGITKPANLKGVVPKIADFGLAKVLGETSDLTRFSSIIGTPAYLAPEQAGAKSSTLTHAVDIYALGVILYESLTGHPPFQANDLHATLRMICEQTPVSPRLAQPTMPRDLETICLKCLEKEPSGRYATAAELADDLERFLQGRPIMARPVIMPVKAWRWCRRNRHEAAAIVVAVASLVSLAVGAVCFAYVQADLRLMAQKNGQLAINEARRAQSSEIEARSQRDLARTQFEASSHVLHNIGNMLVISKTKPDSDLKRINQKFQKNVLILSENYLNRPDLHTDSPDMLALSIFNAARANNDLDQPAEAIRLYEWLLDLLKKSPLPKLGNESNRHLATNATLSLAELYVEKNEPEKAIALLQPFWQNPFAPPFHLPQNPSDPGGKQIRLLTGSKLRSCYMITNKPELARQIDTELEKLGPAKLPTISP